MEVLTNKTVKGMALDEVIDKIYNNYYDNLEKSKIIIIKCIDGEVKIHDTLIKPIKYFNRLLSSEWNNNEQQSFNLDFNVNEVRYLVKLLYKINNTDIVSYIDLIKLYDYILLPNIFIDNIITELIKQNDNDYILYIIKSGISISKISLKRILKYIKNNNVDSSKLINLFAEYYPEYTSEIIEYKVEEIKKINNMRMPYFLIIDTNDIHCMDRIRKFTGFLKIHNNNEMNEIYEYKLYDQKHPLGGYKKYVIIEFDNGMNCENCFSALYRDYDIKMFKKIN